MPMRSSEVYRSFEVRIVYLDILRGDVAFPLVNLSPEPTLPALLLLLLVKYFFIH